jgi:hypothetical protein
MNLENIGAVRGIDRAVSAIDTRKAYDETVSVVSFENGARWLSHNGYVSLVFTDGRQAALQETIIGALPYLFSGRTESAFTIGVASGVTAGALGLLYDEVHAAEISPAVIDTLPAFSDVNYNVLDNSAVNISVQDGMFALMAIPTMISSVLLAPKVMEASLDYFSRLYTFEVYDT